MDEKPKNGDEEAWKAWSAALEEKYQRQAAAQDEMWRRLEAENQEEFIGQNNVMYGGLIGVGIVMVQPFLTASTEVIDLTARICIIAWSIAVPLLAALILVNRHETYRRRLARTFLVAAAQSIALSTGFAGVVAGFWHILPAAGIAVLVCGIVAVFIHSAGYTWLERKHAEAEAVPEGAEPEPEGAEAVRDSADAEPEGADAVPDEGSGT